MSTTPLLSKQRIAVVDVGEIVEMTVGNSTLTMGYETALQLSQWLRVHGKKAKRNAGDTSRHWSAVAMIEGLKN